ncbi:Uncharacterized protein FWK35_00020339 [Aphis craccivora]|uniref:Uncharacterized protein n=1 Tax=Aphis craccivora TaxID=307492 RepID=A0A6G0ZG08_APHCR|nr:Uncharacterized protein FWK35_00020339 [Aphis craccivora]
MTVKKKPGDDRSSTPYGEKTPSWPGDRIAMTRRLSLCATEIFIIILPPVRIIFWIFSFSFRHGIIVYRPLHASTPYRRECVCVCVFFGRTNGRLLLQRQHTARLAHRIMACAHAANGGATRLYDIVNDILLLRYSRDERVCATFPPL